MRTYQLRIAIVCASLWFVLSPLVRARIHAWRIGCPVTEVFPHYSFDLLLALGVAAPLAAAWGRKRWAGFALIAAALLMLTVSMTNGGHTLGAGLMSISVLALVVIAYGVFFAIDGPGPRPGMLVLRALLVVIYGLAAIGTPSAYLYLVAGAVGGVQGIAEGRYALGALLTAFATLAVVALWKLWSIGQRLWRDGVYRSSRSDARLKDPLAVVLGWAALVGLSVLGSVLHRFEEIIFFAILLAPALLLATATHLFPRPQSAPSEANRPSILATLQSLKVHSKDLPGFACGSAVGLLGILYLAPRPTSGWGPCPWTIIYPLHHSLWPRERGVIFDACSDGLNYIAPLSALLSMVCFAAGAAAGAIGGSGSAARGAWATAVVATYALSTLIASDYLSPSGPYIGWFSTLTLGAAIVAGAAWFGYLGAHAARRASDRVGTGTSVLAKQ